MTMICSSLTCSNYASDYCKKCSHANYIQEQELDGKVYRWEFNPMFGPLFLRKDYEPMKRQPIPKSKAWDAFELYMECDKNEQSLY